MNPFRIAPTEALAVHGFAPASSPTAGGGGELPPEARRGEIGEIAVVFTPVDRAEYEGPRGEQNLQDLQWLLPRVEHHQRAVAALLERGAVLPVRFATLFSDRAGLEAWLESRRGTIHRALDGLRDHEEWGLRLLDGGAPADSAPTAAPAASGTAYLLAKKRRRDAASSRREQLERAADRLSAQLEAAVSRIRSLGVRSFDRPLRQAGGDSRSTLRNWALLIHRDHLDRARERIETCSRSLGVDGAELEISGPWPPYNFCPDFADPLPSPPGSQPP